jgi:hypothetical protein
MLYEGYLRIDEYGCLCLGDGYDYLIDKIAENFSKGDLVSVRYFITDTKTLLEEAEATLLFKSLGGVIDEIDFVLEAYSEWTILEYNEDLIIGGHDMFKELQSYAEKNKYMMMIITHEPNNN